MNKGTVKFFNETKGFGFIKDEKSEKEYFVHSSGLKETITENDEVTYDLEMGKKGLNAVNVKLTQSIPDNINWSRGKRDLFQNPPVMSEKKLNNLKSPDLSELKEVIIDKKTKIYIAQDADVEEAKTRYLYRGPSKRVK